MTLSCNDIKSSEVKINNYMTKEKDKEVKSTKISIQKYSTDVNIKDVTVNGGNLESALAEVVAAEFCRLISPRHPATRILKNPENQIYILTEKIPRFRSFRNMERREKSTFGYNFYSVQQGMEKNDNLAEVLVISLFLNEYNLSLDNIGYDYKTSENHREWNSWWGWIEDDNPRYYNTAKIYRVNFSSTFAEACRSRSTSNYHHNIVPKDLNNLLRFEHYTPDTWLEDLNFRNELPDHAIHRTILKIILLPDQLIKDFVSIYTSDENTIDWLSRSFLMKRRDMLSRSALELPLFNKYLYTNAIYDYTKILSELKEFATDEYILCEKSSNVEETIKERMNLFLLLGLIKQNKFKQAREFVKRHLDINKNYLSLLYHLEIKEANFNTIGFILKSIDKDKLKSFLESNKKLESFYLICMFKSGSREVIELLLKTDEKIIDEISLINFTKRKNWGAVFSYLKYRTPSVEALTQVFLSAKSDSIGKIKDLLNHENQSTSTTTSEIKLEIQESKVEHKSSFDFTKLFEYLYVNKNIDTAILFVQRNIIPAEQTLLFKAKTQDELNIIKTYVDKIGKDKFEQDFYASLMNHYSKKSLALELSAYKINRKQRKSTACFSCLWSASTDRKLSIASKLILLLDGSSTPELTKDEYAIINNPKTTLAKMIAPLRDMILPKTHVTSVRKIAS